ncbi:MAG: type II toxin-antitoxin system prevent-host-death family antitoxin [Rhodococcus sp.]|nr:type II toxin-antitoxin system prevent-host-death family antitoxin [Rhodococcus sp. (in: high G+C Gram-positive bacteria)]
MAVLASQARKSLEALIEQVNDDCLPVEIVSEHGSAVLVPKAEWDAIEETAYLLRSPANARRLAKGLEQARRGEVIERDLIED